MSKASRAGVDRLLCQLDWLNGVIDGMFCGQELTEHDVKIKRTIDNLLGELRMKLNEVKASDG